MSRINSWKPTKRPVYLRHPDSGRVLELFQSEATEEFIALLRLCGYLPARKDDYTAQQAQQRKRQRPDSTARAGRDGGG